MKFVRTLVQFFIHSNLFIALAAVSMAFQTQIELLLPLTLRPFHFLLFFATLFEYNLHRLNTMFFYPLTLKEDKYRWMRKHPILFRLICLISFIGLIISLFYMKPEVVISLIPLALLTVFYSIPIFKWKGKTYKLRDIPYLKIFLIALVWSGVCTILPYIEAGVNIEPIKLIWLLFIHALFIFAITIPFDVRDLRSDSNSGLKTLAHATGETRAYKFASITIGLNTLLSCAFAIYGSNYILMTAYVVGGFVCLYVLNSTVLKVHDLYYQGYLDACIPMQFILVLISHFLRNLF